jgi:8-oxo-dGTP diphosphatase
MSEQAEVLAAGGLVRRTRGGPTEIAVVHRPKYDDWSLPKGKLDPGEDFEQAALREVEEETGIRARVVGEVGETTYRDGKGRSKLVRYYEMAPEDEDDFEPNDEVDELRWVPVEEAAGVLTYDFDRELVESAAGRIGGA